MKALRRVGVITAVLIVLIFGFAVEGYFVYRYYDTYYGVGAVTEATESPGGTSEVTTLETTAEETTASGITSEEAEEATFVHRAESRNIVGNSTYLDRPETNKNSKAVLLVKGVRRPGRGASYNHNIGVWYDANRGGKWAVFNQDRVSMTDGLTFEMVVLTGAEKLVHRAKPSNTVGNTTYIDSPLTNGQPNAVVSITQDWNPGGGAGTYNDHHVVAQYDAARKKWAIYNEDAAAMPAGAAFNISVSRPHKPIR